MVFFPHILLILTEAVIELTGSSEDSPEDE